MTDMYVAGPGAIKLFSGLGVKSFKSFEVGRGKQFVSCNYDGYVIGDVILIRLDQNLFNLVGRASVHNWVQYHAETSGYDVRLERDERAAVRQGPIVRKSYRYQIQGPNAMKLMEKVSGKPAPNIRFFDGCGFTIAGREVRALRHGMAGQPGFELYGPWAEGEAVRTALIDAGQ